MSLKNSTTTKMTCGGFNVMEKVSMFDNIHSTAMKKKFYDLEQSKMVDN